MMINAFVSILLSVCPFQEENDPALLCARQMMDAEFAGVFAMLIGIAFDTKLLIMTNPFQKKAMTVVKITITFLSAFHDQRLRT